MKRLVAAIALISVLGVSAFAGEILTPPCAPPDSGEILTPPCASPGQIETPPSSLAPGQTDTPPAADTMSILSVTEAAMDLMLLF
jgi:hypothetical protein